jgi:hypothetical protein
MPLYNDHVQGTFGSGTRLAQGMGMNVEQGMDSILTFFNFSNSMTDHMRSFMEEGTTMKWLADYIRTQASPTTSYQWAIEVAGFLRAGKKEFTAYQSADYSEAGKPENWLPYFWNAVYGLECSSLDAIELPKTIKALPILQNPVVTNRPEMPTWFVLNQPEGQMIAWRKGSATGELIYEANEDMAVYLTWVEKYISENQDNSEVLELLKNNDAPHDIVVDCQLSKDNYQTICLPFDVETLEGTPYEGATVLEFVDVQLKSVGDVEQLDLVFEERTAWPVLEAGKPYLIKPVDDIQIEVTWVGVQEVKDLKTVEYEVGMGGKVVFGGLMAPTAIAAGNYLLNTQNQLERLSVETELPALHAYFQITGVEENTDLNVDAGDHFVTTKCETIKANKLNAKKIMRDGRVYISVDGQLYTLTGARVQ